MSKRKLMTLFTLFGLLFALTLTACGGGATEEPAEEAAEAEVEEAADTEAEEEMAEEEEPAEEEIAEDILGGEETEPEETVEAAEEEMEEEATAEAETEEEMEEEEAMEEEMAEGITGLDSCDVAEDGPFAGVDPSGESIIWWHNHSGDREEQLLPLVEQFNETNACGITVEALNQGGCKRQH